MDDPNKYSGTYNNAQWTLYSGDALEMLRKIESESVDCIVTSPPYFWLRDYGIDGQIGLEDTVENYINTLNIIGEECFRVLKKEGTFFFNIGDTYYSGKGASQGKDAKSKKRRFGLRAVDKSGGMDIGFQKKSLIGIPWRAAMRFCENKWVLRSSIIWHRDKCLPESVKDRPRRSYEFIFMFSKSRHYFFDRKPLIDKNVDEDVWTIAPKTGKAGKLDTAPFPEELVERCISIGCPKGGTVLDPFVGSGTTIDVSLANGYNAIGIELNNTFCDYILSKLQK
ncbi:DNA-methyltransferase [Flavobacterium silvaticum]|uniref:Methyltransferase n=1 Tax=Flavobacterium silvaticum TaxID=1852020 RepID=A0A972FXA1_9FLAO|nr:site-specific DNA-methyltransferase [Flavobacterium silvaticum]NMH26541.1 site-specific DNA-methyltransferase [Flavobacterium silvaticum]